MRTTLTLDPDVGIELEALRRKHRLSLKDAVNNALRRGLRAMAEGDAPKPRFATSTVDLGPSLLPLDSVAEALAAAEGERFH